MKLIILSLILLSTIYNGFGQDFAKGYVYHDTNKNQVRDNNEAGIPGVAVSNGREIVVSNMDGSYKIPISDNTVIFVIKPRDWMTPLNEDNLPIFYYLHKPNPYPDNFLFESIAETGPLPVEVNFPLYKEESPENYKMIVFGDPQPYDIQDIDYLAEDIISELIENKDLEFGITMGDIVGDDLDLFSPLNQAVAKVGIPWYNALGNHDVNYMAPNDELSDETFESVYGPATYAFIYGDVHFIVLDDVIHNSEVGSRGYVGGLRPDQLDFVENYLKLVPKEDLIVLNMHIPLVQHGETFRRSDQKKLFELLGEFPNTLSISAHTHVHNNGFFHKDSTEWLREKAHHHFNVGTTSGSWWNGMNNELNVPHTMMRDGTPNGYSFISFKGTDYIIDWKSAGSPEDYQMNIHLPRSVSRGTIDTVLMTVNFFNGSEQSKIEYRINGSENWEEMEQVSKYDPFYVNLVERWDIFKKLDFPETWRDSINVEEKPFPGTPLPQPVISTHLWEANLGSDFPVGRHVVEVRARDRYGRIFTDYATFRVVGE